MKFHVGEPINITKVATIKRFEDLEIWILARELADEIYNQTIKGTFSSDNDLKWQIRKSSGSTMDNIAEGFERDGRKEFIQFLSIAKGSAGETRSQLYRAHDRNHIKKQEVDLIITKCLTISEKISKLMSYLKNTDIKGTKYKTSN